MRPGDYKHRKQRVTQLPYAVGARCPDRNEFWALDLIGEPEEGTVTIEIDITKDETVHSGEIVLNWDTTAEDAQTAFEAHPGIAEGDVNVTGGNWPFRTLIIEFQGDLAGLEIGIPFVDRSELLPLFWTGVNFSRYPGSE